MQTGAAEELHEATLAKLVGNPLAKALARLEKGAKAAMTAP